MSSNSALDYQDLPQEAVWQARVDLAACFRMAAKLGLHEGVCNHFSAMLPGSDELFFVNPDGFSFEEITASRLLVCHLDGRVLDGKGEPEATAFYIHARLHRLLPRARAAFHTHMPYTTALAMTEEQPLRWAGQNALKFYGRVAVDSSYNGLALEEREGDRIAGSVGAADVVFMKNHGVLVLARSIHEAWDDLYYLERAAQAQVLAESTGRTLAVVSDEVATMASIQMTATASADGRKHLDSVRRRLTVAGENFDD